MDPKKEVITSLRVCLYSNIGLQHHAKSKVHELLSVEKFLGEAADIILEARKRTPKRIRHPRQDGRWKPLSEWPKEIEGQ